MLEDEQIKKRYEGIIYRIVNSMKKSIKDYPAQMALIIPLSLGAISGIFGFMLYLKTKGYCRYFNIREEFIYFNIKFSLYELVRNVGITLLIWCYCIVAIRILFAKKLYFFKIVFWIFFPGILALGYASIANKWLYRVVLFGLMYIIVWTLMFMMGDWIVSPLHEDIRDRKKSKIWEKFTIKPIASENLKDKDYKVIGVAIIIVALIVYPLICEQRAYDNAKGLKQFDIVKIEESDYAVIVVNEEKSVALKVEERGDGQLIIDTNDWRVISIKNMQIVRKKYHNVIKIEG